MASKKESRRAKQIAAQKDLRMTAPERVCGLLRQGHALRAIAARKRMPTLDTLTRWLTEDSAFRADYDRAREAQREIFADDVVALADALAGSSAAGLKLRIDARKWRVALMDKQTAAKGKKDRGGPPDDLIERLEEAERRIAEQNAAASDAPPNDATAAADRATDNEVRDADGDEARTVVHRPKADAAAAAGEDTSWRDNAREWATGVYGPTHGSGGDGVLDNGGADEWWR
jgi:hypothetical protein